jgi:hypothetical protein
MNGPESNLCPDHEKEEEEEKEKGNKELNPHLMCSTNKNERHKISRRKSL